METIEIKSLKTETPENPWDFVVDNRSVLGNPFFENEWYSREDVCEAYKIYFYNRINTFDTIILEEVRILYYAYKEYGKLNLFCWEAPKKCHANTIREYLYNYLSNNSI